MIFFSHRMAKELKKLNQQERSKFDEIVDAILQLPPQNWYEYLKHLWGKNDLGKLQVGDKTLYHLYPQSLGSQHRLYYCFASDLDDDVKERFDIPSNAVIFVDYTLKKDSQIRAINNYIYNSYKFYRYGPSINVNAIKSDNLAVLDTLSEIDNQTPKYTLIVALIDGPPTGGTLVDGKWIERNISLGIKLLKEIAHTPICFNEIGEYYLFDEYIERNDQEALIWFEKAAKKGHVPAMYHLADIYRNSEKVNLRNTTKSKAWLNKSVNKGYPEALNMLGDMYIADVDTPRDFLEAIKWYEKAESKGSDHAKFQLARIYLGDADSDWAVTKRDLTIRKPKLGLAKLLELVEFDYMPAIKRIAAYYANGDYEEPEYQKALVYYNQLIDLGYQDLSGLLAMVTQMLKLYSLGKISKTGLLTKQIRKTLAKVDQTQPVKDILFRLTYPSAETDMV